LVKASDTTEVLALQKEYLKAQSERLATQLKELSELSARAALETAEAGKSKS